MSKAVKALLSKGKDAVGSTFTPGDPMERGAVVAAVASLFTYAMSRGYCDCCILRDAMKQISVDLRGMKYPLNYKDVCAVQRAYDRTGDLEEAMAVLPFRNNAEKMLAAFVVLHSMGNHQAPAVAAE